MIFRFLLTFALLLGLLSVPKAHAQCWLIFKRPLSSGVIEIGLGKLAVTEVERRIVVESMAGAASRLAGSVSLRSAFTPNSFVDDEYGFNPARLPPPLPIVEEHREGRCLVYLLKVERGTTVLRRLWEPCPTELRCDWTEIPRKGAAMASPMQREEALAHSASWQLSRKYRSSIPILQREPSTGEERHQSQHNGTGGEDYREDRFNGNTETGSDFREAMFHACIDDGGLFRRLIIEPLKDAFKPDPIGEVCRYFLDPFIDSLKNCLEIEISGAISPDGQKAILGFAGSGHQRFYFVEIVDGQTMFEPVDLHLLIEFPFSSSAWHVRHRLAAPIVMPVNDLD